MAALVNTVIVDDVTYEAGSTPPGEVARQITNPAAWEGGIVPDGARTEPPAGEPPRAGTGSGTEEWAAYATGLGLDIPADAKRDEIIATVDAR
ncbi:hypothetical protein [Iamia sp.]|uniref:hypothetical protein n=1 Tax=Iamia sp. TaxID=2722710 RepID=UPI002CB1E298|nr:hypothetical protein [Iamia sp.]HXH57730.1 hypothetical protein [Iamia sp.]